MNLILIALLLLTLALSGSLVADGTFEGGARIQLVPEEKMR